MIQNLRNKHLDKIISICGSGPTALTYAGDSDICIALNGSIQIEQPIDYSMMFDLTLSKALFFNIKPEVTRILGCGLAPLSPILYKNLPDDKVRKIKGSSVTSFDYPDPTSPHLYFRYEVRREPEFNPEMSILSSVGNIAIPALETAIIMGAKEIRIYGIDMNRRARFYEGNKDLGAYSDISAKFFNGLIELCQQNGIIVRVARGPESKITSGDEL